MIFPELLHGLIALKRGECFNIKKKKKGGAADGTLVQLFLLVWLSQSDFGGVERLTKTKPVPLKVRHFSSADKTVKSSFST